MIPGPETGLRARIADEIARDGPIPFSRYMELCLYEPELGYYSRPREQFGRAGDFYTSSDVHAVFGRLLTRQFEEMWRAMDSPTRIDLVELGPGRGLFARDVLDWSAKQFPDLSLALHYLLVEQSPYLREKLRERLSEHIDSERCEVPEPLTLSPTDGEKGGAPGGRCDIFDSLEAATAMAGDNIIVFGNEFFDALPVEIVDHRGAVRVGHENGRFAEAFAAPSPAEDEFLDRYGVHPEEGGRVEAPLASMSWIERIANEFRGRRGFLVLIDYGYTREEQLAGRHRDTIMCYRQHTASSSPYQAPGEQDITAHVNFTALRARGEERGLEAIGLVTQSQFLIGIGEGTEFADAFQDCVLPQERAKVALQLKHLISPAGMGETFQVLVMSHNVGGARLSGLKLGR